MPKNDIINWLLEDSNPAVKYRTQTEILELSGDLFQAKDWIKSRLPDNWYETNGLWYRYYLSAFAECGLSRNDLHDDHVRKAFDELDTVFDCSCGDFMLLRALVKLGYYDNDAVKKTITAANGHILSDGGFLCIHRLDKLNYTPKSCYKACLHALLLAAECKKKGLDCLFTNRLINYFMNHNLFFRTDNKEIPVLNARPGWRTTDTFYPFEVMRVGLQNVIEAFCALGYGDEPWMSDAWDILNGYKDATGKTILKGTLAKSYLPKDNIGKPGKWVTFYTLLAEKEREQ